jgi:hypothetical protein
MIDSTKLFPSVNCDANVLAQLLENSPVQPDPRIVRGDFGYALVKDHLVPFSFIARLQDHLSSTVFSYDNIWSPREMCGEIFWSTLDETERNLIGHCFLILIEQGLIALTFPEQVTL